MLGMMMIMGKVEMRLKFPPFLQLKEESRFKE